MHVCRKDGSALVSDAMWYETDFVPDLLKVSYGLDHSIPPGSQITDPFAALMTCRESAGCGSGAGAHP